MKPVITIAIAFFILIWGASLQAQVVVKEKPFAPETQMAKSQTPGPGMSWIDGQWKWDKKSKQYVWVPGHWEKGKPHHIWVPGNWVSVDGGVVWIPGKWIKIEKIKR